VASPRIAYARRSDATAEAETTAVANVYAFILNCHARKKATRPGGPDDTDGLKNDRTARTNYTK
jgi:hypothetical protein